MGQHRSTLKKSSNMPKRQHMTKSLVQLGSVLISCLISFLIGMLPMSLWSNINSSFSWIITDISFRSSRITSFNLETKTLCSSCLSQRIKRAFNSLVNPLFENFDKFDMSKFGVGAETEANLQYVKCLFGFLLLYIIGEKQRNKSR